jgi:hypothetical protein
MKKNYTFALGVILTTLTLSFTSCNNDKSAKEDSSKELNEGVMSLSDEEIELEAPISYENQTFILKHKGQDWEVNKAEWEEWKVENAKMYEEKMQATDEIFNQGLHELEHAAIADALNGYINMEMVGANRMPMTVVMLMQLKSMHLNGGKKGFE